MYIVKYDGEDMEKYLKEIAKSLFPDDEEFLSIINSEIDKEES